MLVMVPFIMKMLVDMVYFPWKCPCMGFSLAMSHAPTAIVT